MRGLLLTWEPRALEIRIRLRTRAMLHGGAIEEVAALPELGPTAANRAAGAQDEAALSICTKGGMIMVMLSWLVLSGR